MKIRQGFVSNSSSSSFVIACKGDLKKELRRVGKINTPLERFPSDHFNDVSRTSNPFNPDNSIIDEIVEAFIYSADEVDTDAIDDPDKFEDLTGYDLEWFKQEYPKIYSKIKYFGWKLYEGSVSDQTEEVGERIAVSLDIDYEDENIIIKKESYY